MTPGLFPASEVLTVPGRRLEFVPPARWIFRLPGELVSLNHVIGAHWAVSQSKRLYWEREIRLSLDTYATLRGLERPASSPRGTLDELQAWHSLRQHREKRRVTIARFVPHKRCFIADDDNLPASAKPLFDALVRLQLLVDDRRAWVERAPITQQIASDRQFWTVVQIDRPDVRGAWR
jgi:hypothetical protein